jgi:hypothetical protein
MCLECQVSSARCRVLITYGAWHVTPDTLESGVE